jgi:hypothetical protein
MAEFFVSFFGVAYVIVDAARGLSLKERAWFFGCVP